MGCTVFADSNGLFHRGSDGKGLAFPDVCLSPPPAPTGPIPVPYPNKAAAADLAEGSTTVSIEGEPTALKDQSYTSTTSGDEGGTQGGGVVTHKTQGKAYFKFWSFDVFIEGLNVDCHSDPMGQNTGSNTINGLCLRSSVVRAAYQAAGQSDCTEPYSNDEHHDDPNTAQKKQARSEWQKNGRKCWECGRAVTFDGADNYHDDHFPPLVVQWYAGGCHQHKQDPQAWKDQCRATRCRPHCEDCSGKQSTAMRKFNAKMIAKLGL
jgi:hypothetical protein